MCIFARQINGRCNAASVAALLLEDMQTFPQSANGNRLFPDNGAPSWEILSCKIQQQLACVAPGWGSSLLWAGNKCQDTFILKLNAQLILKGKPGVYEYWCETCTKWWEKNGIFKRKASFAFFFFFFKWWPMQRGEMTSQLDLHFTLWFESTVSVLCQFLHSFWPQAQRPRWTRNRESAVAFESGATQNQFITATAKWINRLIEPECYDCYIAHHRRINGILIGIDQYQSNSYMS